MENQWISGYLFKKTEFTNLNNCQNAKKQQDIEIPMADQMEKVYKVNIIRIAEGSGIQMHLLFHT